MEVVVVEVVVLISDRLIFGIFTPTRREMFCSYSTTDVIDEDDVDVAGSKGDWTGRIGIVGTDIGESSGV